MSALRQLIEMLGRASTMDEVEALAGRLAVLSGICEEWAPLLAESFFRARAQLELGYWSALSDWTTWATSTESEIRSWPALPRPHCTQGCACCCHQRVAATPFEVLLVLERLRSRPDSPRVLGQLRAGHGAYETPKQVCKPKPPCALLEADGSCGAYEARPSACRGEHSLDRAQCERGTHHPFVRQLLTLPYAIYGGLDLACFGMGLDTHGVDLERALLELWEVRQPWARWLAGARLFSSGSAALVRADYDLIQIQPWSQR